MTELPAKHLPNTRAFDPALRERLVAWRHHLHAHPELARHEVETSAFVRARLDELGIPYEAGIGGYGIVATLSRGGGRGSVGLRADMDALAIREQTDLPYASRREGLMHACGHDGHTTSLLGAAALLAADPEWEGTVRFIFQPAEEGGYGARAMIEDGLFERFPCDRVFAFHNWPGLPVGTLAVRPGVMMAATSRFSIRLVGRASHAAMPHQGADPLVAAAHVILAIQSIVSRRVDPLDSAVVSVTMLEASQAYNQIAEAVALGGTMRFLHTALREEVEAAFRTLVTGVAGAYGVRAEIDLCRGVDPATNAEAEAAIAARAAESAGLPLLAAFEPSLGGEDFARMLALRPGALVWIGNGPTEGGNQLHSPTYRFDDEILPAASSWFAEVAKEALRAAPPA